MTAPTIYLTNPSGLKAGKGGPGAAHLITIAPPRWLLAVSERLCLSGCPPSAGMMMQARKGRLPLLDYERACRVHWAKDWTRFRPGQLSVVHAPVWLEHRDRTAIGTVTDGDTLLCVCGARQPCHRRWLAHVLLLSGWRVVLDGIALGGPDAPASPSDPSSPQLGLFSPSSTHPPSPRTR